MKKSAACALVTILSRKVECSFLILKKAKNTGKPIQKSSQFLINLRNVNRREGTIVAIPDLSKCTCRSGMANIAPQIRRYRLQLTNYYAKSIVLQRAAWS